MSDVRGVLPYHGEGLAAIIDARRRLLRKGGAMIPERDIVLAALVRERTVARLAAPWRDNVAGVSMDAMWRMVSNAMHSVRLRRADLASPPRRAAVLDYRTLASDRGPEISGRLDRPARHRRAGDCAVVRFAPRAGRDVIQCARAGAAHLRPEVAGLAGTGALARRRAGARARARRPRGRRLRMALDERGGRHPWGAGTRPIRSIDPSRARRFPAQA